MNLKEFFKEHGHIALAYSGGADSCYLLYAAIDAGADVTAYYVKSPFQPQFELDDAIELADKLGAKMKILHADPLDDKTVADNPPDRCYYCKKAIFKTILDEAARDGYTEIMDGTNASDDEGDRPGVRALKEMSVFSPLRICGLTKDTIRRLSKEAGLKTWNKPAYACLATRVPYGQALTYEKLEATEKCEEYLFSLGFTDFRIRMAGTAAKLEMPENQLVKVIEHREKILNFLKRYYSSVLLNLEVR